MLRKERGEGVFVEEGCAEGGCFCELAAGFGADDEVVGLLADAARDGAAVRLDQRLGAVA
ncbi:MAG: hypothetical protein ABI837_18890 [Acidobacteriota bacterium]